MSASIFDTYYGKRNVTVYRTYAQPLTGIRPIPESGFIGRSNTLFAADIDVIVYGKNFTPAYEEGDNRMVVATDTMKNFILKQSMYYPGSTLEGLLEFLGAGFLATYPQMGSLRISAREETFDHCQVPAASGPGPSDRLFARRHDDRGFAELLMARELDRAVVSDHICGRLGFELIKITGSSFSNFVRDQHTTLPDRTDRPLFIHMDVKWRYADSATMLAEPTESYVPAEQIRDIAQVVFHEFNSRSIQHLVHEMGKRILDRFPQLNEVSFDAQNRIWDNAATHDGDPRIKAYCDPRPPYGSLGLVMKQGEQDDG
ncbi:MAG: urate oxidase [Spirochaetaceae bacterium]|nr:MAG: urate oxidase [Spirochaetaceae bacterium]